MAEHANFAQFHEALTAACVAIPPPRIGEVRLLWCNPSQLDERQQQRWDDLGFASATVNPFVQPWFLQPALVACDPLECARLLVVEHLDGQWLGALPVVQGLRHGRAPLPHWQGWRHPNQFMGSPLIRAGMAEVFWRAVLDGLALATRGELALCLFDLPLDDPGTRGLMEVCIADGRSLAIDRQFDRALLRSGSAPALKAKHRSRIAALERKLTAELGPVEFGISRDPTAINSAIAQFLALEHAGWKGAGGSALACQTGTAQLFAAAARHGAERGFFELASLQAGGRLLALSTQFIAGDCRFGFKMAYDEQAARYAPGLLLLNRITAAFAEAPVGQTFDSCAVPDQQPVSRLWSDRRTLIDCRIGIGGPVRNAALKLIMAGEGTYARLKGLAEISPQAGKS